MPRHATQRRVQAPGRCRVVPGESAHVLGRRHDLSRNLIRIWVEKAGAGQLDEDVALAELLGEYKARIAALERLVGQQALEIAFFEGARKNTRAAEKRAYIRDDRPDGLSVERGCELMGLPRSTYYATPQERPSEAALVAESERSPTSSSATATAKSAPSCATAAMWSMPRRCAG